jgi:hypothetical protein
LILSAEQLTSRTAHKQYKAAAGRQYNGRRQPVSCTTMFRTVLLRIVDKQYGAAMLWMSM